MSSPRPVPPPPGVDKWAALLAYDGAARELLARLKYRNSRTAVAWLAAGMASLVAGWVQAAGGHVALTWAPTTRDRARSRGFDQAELLARATARRLGVPTMALLDRIHGPPQTGRSGTERRRGPAFSASGVPERAPPRLLLVDDIATTGSTLGAAARALKSAGADEIWAVVAGRKM